MYNLRFDMRAPEIGAPTVQLYSAATEMCAWAENHGALAAILCEHHGSEDGYLPSPLILAAAIAARTERLALSLILLLPFYDAVRLAEDMAVLDIISKGRASYILALGYRPEEFEHFGVDMRTRGKLVDEKLALLRELLSGTAVFEGRHINTTPPPHTEGGPMLMWGGGTIAAARSSCPLVTTRRCASSPTTSTRHGTNWGHTCYTTSARTPHGIRAMTPRQDSRM